MRQGVHMLIHMFVRIRMSFVETVINYGSVPRAAGTVLIV